MTLEGVNLWAFEWSCLMAVKHVPSQRKMVTLYEAGFPAFRRHLLPPGSAGTSPAVTCSCFTVARCSSITEDSTCAATRTDTRTPL